MQGNPVYRSVHFDVFLTLSGVHENGTLGLK